MEARDTAPIRPEESFDEATVAAYLQASLPEFFPPELPVTFDQFPGGAANLTYRARAGDHEVVLRRAPLGEVAPGAHDMVREYRVLSQLGTAYPEAPRAFHLCEDPRVMGKPFFVMERRRGWVIRNTWPDVWADEDHSIRTRLAENLVRALGRLHLVEPADVDLGDLGRPNGFVERQVTGWKTRWDAAKTREVEAMETVAAVLQARVPVPQAVTLLHNDYKLDNTMVAADGSLEAVFDWDMATRGDPLVDLGTLLAYWPDPQSVTFPVFGERAVALAPYLPKDDVGRLYAEVTGFDVSAVDYYEGLALFRIAVIIEQIFSRFVSGQTNDQRFAQFEPLAPLLAQAALRMVEAR